MRIDYSKLWKLLIDKNMTKSELMEMSGISSRVIAKLSKNQTVNTDTLLRICETLNCCISDILECIDEEKMSIYQAYHSLGKVTDKNELYETISFTKGEKNYTVYISKQRATKATHIECRENNTIYWIQLYPFGGISNPSRVESILIKPTFQQGTTLIVLIKGKPGTITGLDEGFFVSNRGVPKSQECVYVMSEGAFKLFDLN